MSVLSFVIRILPILLLTTPTASLLTNPTTIIAHVPRTTDAPLTECSSVCALMEAQIRQPAGPDQGSLFRSLCINSGRTDCDAMQTEFRVELVGKGDGFKCLCARNGAPGQEYGSTTTTTSTTTVTMTEGAPVAEEPASSGVADNAASSVSNSVQSSVTVPTSISDVPISTTLIRVPLSTISSTILSTHTTLSTIRYAVSSTSKSGESTSTSTPTSKATSSSEAELNTAGELGPSKKPNSGAITGIVIGVLAACGIIGGGAWLIRKRQLAKIADKKFDYDY